MDRVIHAAGATWAATGKDFFTHNAQGTKNLLDACLKQQTMERFVLISSLAAAGPGTRLNPAVETAEPKPISPYGMSKLAAEKCCEAVSDRLSTVILRPSAVYGPRDTGFLPYFQLVRRGFLIEFGSGTRELSLCHVDDLVSMIVNATNGYLASGSVYFVADSEPYSWGEVESILCAAFGVKGRHIVVPEWVLKTAGVIGQAFGAVSGRTVKISRARAAELIEKHWVCDSTAAQHDLGLIPGTKLENGLLQAVRWYEQNNWL